jgi:hypothetical protein
LTDILQPLQVTQSFLGKLGWRASPQRKRNDGKRSRKEECSFLCKRKASTFLSLSSSLHTPVWKRTIGESLLNSYLRMKTSDEEVYEEEEEEGHHGIAGRLGSRGG